MSKLSWQTLKSAISAILLSAIAIGFVCFSFFDVASIDSVRMQFENKVHATTGAPAMHACCSSGLFNHLELWDNLSVSIPSGFDVLLGLLIVAFVASALPTPFISIKKRVDILSSIYKIRKRHYPSQHIFDPHRVALAQGILHSKAF